MGIWKEKTCGLVQLSWLNLSAGSGENFGKTWSDRFLGTDCKQGTEQDW